MPFKVFFLFKKILKKYFFYFLKFIFNINILKKIKTLTVKTNNQ